MVRYPVASSLRFTNAETLEPPTTGLHTRYSQRCSADAGLLERPYKLQPSSGTGLGEGESVQSSTVSEP